MNNISLKVYEAISLEAEISHLLQLKTPIKLKYLLTELLLNTQQSLTAARTLLTTLFKEHGKPDPQNPELALLPQFYEGTNQKTEAFTEYETINSQEVQLSYKAISLDLFDNIESDQNYPILFRMVE